MSEQFIYQADFTKSGKEMLIDLINWGNRNTLLKPLRAETTWFTHPVAVKEHNHGCNTTIRFAEVAGYRDAANPHEIEYNRVNIDQVAKFIGFDFVLTLPIGKVTYPDTHSLLEPLYNVLKIKLLPEDVINESLGSLTITEVEGEKVYPNIELKITPESIAYYGKLKFEIRPEVVTLDTAIRDTYYPTSFQPVYGWAMG